MNAETPGEQGLDQCFFSSQNGKRKESNAVDAFLMVVVVDVRVHVVHGQVSTRAVRKRKAPFIWHQRYVITRSVALRRYWYCTEIRDY